MQEKGRGKDIVKLTLSKLENAAIFPTDHGFMRRIAFVESKDGKDSDTFPDDPDVKRGVGIWQMDKGTFDWLTKNKTCCNKTRTKYFPLIYKRFEINITSLQRKDLYKPLVAAIVARLLLLTKLEAIPSSLPDQAVYWKKHYNTEYGKGSEDKFLDDVSELERNKSQGGDQGISSFYLLINVQSLDNFVMFCI